ncbi:helix-turn-helix domain-containing protein [Bacillus piscicola]|uniref:helix-turn-helix domain-containing protein n=1 Tax=Bacillus piscicola TaxID=1632684 RepID=UPI001F08FFC2|nr:AraC family transcriptional regulator [Bacillus piscicola]
MSYQAHETAIQRSLKFIEEHLTNELQLTLLAEQAGYSKFHFQRIFRKIIGKSVAAYIRERRITQSARELITTDQRVIDIAITYRFHSQESFTRAFKKVYNTTPGDYRKLLRKLDSKGEFIVSTNSNAPSGWIMTGESPFDYETGLDNGMVHSGNYSAYLKSKNEKAKGFATLMQQIKSDKYRGERVRFSAFVKSTDVKESAGLWMRVDHSSGEVLAFDNMMNRPIKGTNDWNHFSVVLDIPIKSEVIAFGVLLNGSGQIWMDKLGFEVVDDSVPVTEQNPTEGLPNEPLNLDFEDNNTVR